MEASRIQSRAVFKVMAIVMVAIGVALLLNHVIVEVKTTIRWLCAAIFLALALSPLVDLIERAKLRGRSLPRWLAILVAYLIFLAALTLLILAVIPPIVREVEHLGTQLPTYVQDFEDWANNNSTFQDLNHKYGITSLLSQEASQLPSKLGDAAGALQEITVGILNNVVEAIVVLTLTYFLLLDGAHAVQADHGPGPDAGARANPPGRASGSRGSSAPTSRSTCSSRCSPASSPGSRSSCSGSTSRCRWRSSSGFSTSCR